MKSQHIFQNALLMLMLACFQLSCKKETINANNNNPPVNKPPLAYAGGQKTIVLPVDSVYLDGSKSTDPDGRIASFLWNQISGSPAQIIDKHAEKTYAKHLSIGTHKFQLTVSDYFGLSSKDTLTVIVEAAAQGTSPLIANNLAWTFPWYNTLSIPNFYSYVPAGRPFKVFIQRDNNPAWVEVQPFSLFWYNNTYEYIIGDGSSMYGYGSLYIFYYGTDADDTPNVKVEF